MSELPATSENMTKGCPRPPLFRILKTGELLSPALFVLCIISAAVYANTFPNGFVYDDAWQVVRNIWIRDVRFIPDILASDVWRFSGDATSNYYRPVMYLAYMLVYHSFGLDPRAFHALNIILNALVCVLVFLTTTRLLRQFRPLGSSVVLPAFAAAALFATHPVHTEAVAWIAGVPELTYSLFCLLSFYLYARSREGSKGPYALSVAAFFLAAFSKEPALILPLVLIAYDHCLGKARGEHLVNIRRYIPYIAAAALYLAARTLALGQLIPSEKNQAVAAFSSFISIFPLFSAYLVKLLWPLDLNAYTVFEPISSLLTIRGLAGVLVVLAFAAALALSLRKSAIVFLGLLLLAVPLLPALYLPALPENIFAERYLYLPSFGFVLLIAGGLSRIGDDRALPPAGAGIIVIIVVILSSIGTVKRNTIWKNDETFYQDVLSKSPDVAMMHVNLGLSYFRTGRMYDAMNEYKAALELKPDLAEARNNIGMLYERQRLVPEAINEYKTALELEPDYAAAHNNLGNAYMLSGLFREAIHEYQAAVRSSPRFTDAHYNLGNAYAAMGLLDEAVHAYKDALRINPYEVDAHNNLGVAYLRLTRLDEARQEFEAALRIDPRFMPARLNMQRIEQGAN